MPANESTRDVVIGAGHNVFVTACYLAQGGLDMAVLEAADSIGGMTASGTPIPAAPQHVVNYCAVELFSGLRVRSGGELGLER
jgi:ribulose 1,5-bisphosphate synthetase/thiazole synthase